MLPRGRAALTVHPPPAAGTPGRAAGPTGQLSPKGAGRSPRGSVTLSPFPACLAAFWALPLAPPELGFPSLAAPQRLPASAGGVLIAPMTGLGAGGNVGTVLGQEASTRVVLSHRGGC